MVMTLTTAHRLPVEYLEICKDGQTAEGVTNNCSLTDTESIIFAHVHVHVNKVFIFTGPMWGA